MAKPKPSKRQVNCPHCGSSLTASQEWDGRRVRCKKCDKPFRLTLSSSEAQKEEAQNETSEAKLDETVSKRQGAKPPKKGSRDGKPPVKRPAPADAKIATANLGRFEIRSLIRSSPDGSVHRVYDPRLERDVALKTMPVGHEDESRVARFEAEARTVARLRHPNIVPVFESGTLQHQRYIASQFIDGDTLRDRLGRGPIDQRRAAEWIATLADALHYAHQLNVIHRDVKPENILLDEKDQPQLTDFGVARRLDDDANLTIDGSMVGTPAYMSPEQASGARDAVGPASDQYSLAVVFYELLTGRAPLEGEPHAILRDLFRTEVAPPRTHRSSIARDLDAICQKALNKDPQSRYPSVEGFAQDIERWLRGDPVEARPISHWGRLVRWSKRHQRDASLLAGAAVVLVSAALILVVLGVRAAQRASDANDQFTLATEAKESARVETAAAAREKAASEKLGQKLAEQKNTLETQQADLKNKRLAAGEAVKLAVAARAKTAAAQQEAKKALGEEQATKDQLLEAQRKTEHGLYMSLFATANESRLAGNNDEAQKLLARCPINSRNWEWGHLTEGRLQLRPVVLGSEAIVQSARGRSQLVDDAWTLSDDGALLAFRTASGVELWDTKRSRRLKAWPTGLARLRISADGSHVLTWQQRRDEKWNVALFDRNHDDAVFQLVLSATPTAMGINADGSRFAAATYDGLMYWDGSKRKPYLHLPTPGSATITNLQFTGPDTLHMSLCRRTSVKSPKASYLWDRYAHYQAVEVRNSKYRPARQLWQRLTDYQTEPVPNADASRWLLVSPDKGVHISSGSGDQRFIEVDRIRDAAFAAQDNLVVLTDQLEIWDLNDDAKTARLPVPTDAISIKAANQTVVVHSPDGFSALELAKARVVERKRTLPARRLAWGVSPDHEYSVAVDSDSQITVWNGEAHRTFDSQEDLSQCSHIQISNDGRIIDCVRGDQFVRFKDDTAVLRHVMTGLSVRGLSLHGPTSRALVACNNSLVVVDAEAKRMPGPKGTILAATWLPQRDVVAAATEHGLWLGELSSGEWRPAAGIDGSIAASTVAIAAERISLAGRNETRVAIAAGNGTILLWDPIKDEVLHTLQGHLTRIRSIDFSPDSTRLVSTAIDNELRLWDVETGQRVYGMTLIEASKPPARFVDGGKKIALELGDRAIMLLNGSKRPKPDVPARVDEHATAVSEVR